MPSNQSLIVDPATHDEIWREARRLDRSFSWVVQAVWRLTREQFRALPGEELLTPVPAQAYRWPQPAASAPTAPRAAPPVPPAPAPRPAPAAFEPRRLELAPPPGVDARRSPMVALRRPIGSLG